MASENPQSEKEVTTAFAAELQDSQELSEWQLDRILFAMFGMLEKRDPLAAVHCIRVRGYCLLIADAMSLAQAECKILAYAALLHDLGKISIPEAILWKSGKLTSQELELVQKHAQSTYELLERLPFPAQFADVPFIASCHHERLDGSGYFRGLKGDEIPRLARILAVANQFDTLTSVRHYSEPLPVEKAKEVLLKERERRLDAAVVDTLMEISADKLGEIMESGPNFVLR